MKKCNFIVGLMLLGATVVLPTGCTDAFDYLENHEPSWLGPNIYDYLKERGDCNYYVRLIDDCGYTETMQKTGSNTLFFSRDKAFESFFNNNTLGIRSYENMPKSMKYLLMRTGLLSNAQLIERLSQSDKGGIIFRRATSLEVEDTIPVVKYADLPKNNYFSKFQDKSIKLLQDASNWTLVQFFQEVMDGKKITDADFNFITGATRSQGDAYLFSSHIINKDITCKNGYLHELNELLLPPENMASYIRGLDEASKFNSLMDRFCAPVLYKVNPATGDSIFNLRYFNSSTVHPYKTDPKGKTADGLLYYDPGWNLYQATPDGASTQAKYEMDMAAMFVPTNEAMSDYFRKGGEGDDLYTAFGSWDNVPNSIAADFVANHQKYSFIASLPSNFSTIKDEAGYDMEITQSNIVKSYVARNGLVYLVNKVIPPLDYRSVMGPVKIGQTTKVFAMALGDSYCQFQYYLRSLKSTYQFFVTPDVYTKDYFDPVSLGYVTSKRANWKFYKNDNGVLQATAYSTQTGDSIDVIKTAATLSNRLTDILDQQTVVGNLTPGQEYYITKGYAPIRVTWNGSSIANVSGAGNAGNATISKEYEKTNGKTYFINKFLQTSTSSVYATLKAHNEFSNFFNLCEYVGFFSSNPSSTTHALDYKVSFFSQYHYTVYVPTNDAIVKAQNAGIIPTTDEIDAEGDQDVKYELINKLMRFLRYHFQDSSVFIKGAACNNSEYLSATLNTNTNKFYPIYVTNQNDQISLRTNASGSANVIKTNGLYNLMTRDIVVNAADMTKATTIETSSYAVIHQIDNVLQFE